MYRLIKTMLISCILICFICMTCLAFSDVHDMELAAELETLVEFGIIGGYPDGTFGALKNITRAEFSKIIITSIAADKITLEDIHTFSDVPDYHWAAKYINISKSLGIVNGMTPETFAPEAYVTYEQAIKMIVVGLGYEAESQAKGGWPNGYIAVAKELGLTHGVEFNQRAYATRGDITKIIYNALDVPFYNLANDSGTIVREVSDVSLRELHQQIRSMLEETIDGSDDDYYNDNDTVDYDEETEDVGTVG